MEIQKEFGLQSNRKPGARLIRDPDRLPGLRSVIKAVVYSDFFDQGKGFGTWCKFVSLLRFA